MINPFKDVNWRPGTAATRAFGKSLVVGFPIVAGVLLLVSRWQSGVWPLWPLWLGGVGAAVGVICWGLPQIALPFYYVWYGVACSVGIVLSNTILALVYYLTVTPVGLALRCLGKDPMNRRFDRQAATYWVEAENRVDAKRYFRQF
jgi:hypothetical protein